ncbi:hypothetical protein EJB05_29718 [Eragrostis curvula]|uniref:Uncharacterized protein n=1 Tax=Eragrostis curvula TaxID=38414 RepID=A0A5J9UU25_9POAL|nr:hypothetical protein EJB05_29718 [Eragrostis curvula]
MIQGSNITELAANAILGCLVPQLQNPGLLIRKQEVILDRLIGFPLLPACVLST